MSVREDRHAYFCIIEGMTRRAGAYAVSYTHLTLPTTERV